MFRIVLFLIFSVLCVVNTQSDDECRHSRSYTRVKRGRYPGPPIRFYSRPPLTFPIKGIFSYTPPPFMQDDEPPYPGSRLYKVSKRPTYEALGDDDISNLVKNLSKQDFDKILEFASEKDKYLQKGKDVDYEYMRPHKRENLQKPTHEYTKEYTKYQQEKPYELEFKKYVNYVTEATPYKYVPQDYRSSYGPQNDMPSYKMYNQPDSASPPNRNGPQDERLQQYNGLGSQDSQSNLYTPFVFQDVQAIQFKPNELQENQIFPSPSIPDGNYPQGSSGYFSTSSSSDIPESNEEEKLPPPTNMREVDFDISYTNNVPTVVMVDPDSYQVESFGDLPLMDYNSKLHSVSSYHVPHYTVTHSKSESSPPSASSQSYSSSTGLKISPAAAFIKAPPFEPAPPASAAKEQSDAHLKAIKIWSHKSKGAAYTLHDDGTLTPEWPRPPKYGK